MGLELPGSNGRRRQSMLRGVYERNRQIDDPNAFSSSEATTPSARPGAPRAAWLGALLIVMALTGWMYQHFNGGAAEKAASGGHAPRAAATSYGAIVAGPAIAAGRSLFAAASGEHAALVAPAEMGVAGLFGLEVRTVVIDAGHGGTQPGAVGPTGLKEKKVTLDVARRLRDRLDRHPGYRILLTRGWDETLSLKERVTFANTHDADLFVSVHVNWIPDSSVTCIETYYFGKGDAETLALARRENRNSGYTVADFNEMIEAVGSTMRRQESRKLAHTIQQSVYENVRSIDKDVADWGVKTAPFVVLLGVEAPSVLTEIGVLSNRVAEARLRTRAYREKLAAFLEEGIIGYLNTRGVALTLASPVTIPTASPHE